jgi:hypothetical protein
MPLTAEQIKLLEKPFEKDEHSVVQGNPYILKSAIRRRLWQVDLNYQLGAPELVIHDQDVIVLRGSLTVGGVTHFGVGTGLIIRTRKDEKTGEIFDLPLYDIARNMAKAYKQAASDILPRAAIQFNCGAYLAEKPKGMSLDTLLEKLAGKKPQPESMTPAVKLWANEGAVANLMKRCAEGLGLTWLDVTLFTGIASQDDYAAWNAKYPTLGAAAEAIKLELEKKVAALPPATPKQPAAVP